MHLGAKYLNNPRKNERRVISWLDSVKDTAKAIYLMGDILDYWYEYKHVVPRGFTRFFGKIAELTDSGIEIYWFIGNHDIWIFDYLPSEIGVKVVDGYLVKNIDGKRFFLSHGDGIGDRKLSFRIIRSLFRNKFCQFLFSAIHPRWTIPFAHGWSSQSRSTHPVIPHFNGEDEAYLFRFARQYEATQQHIDYFIFGHLHIAQQSAIAHNSTVTILGDWISLFSYAKFDGSTLKIEYFKEQA